MLYGVSSRRSGKRGAGGCGVVSSRAWGLLLAGALGDASGSSDGAARGLNSGLYPGK